MRRSIFSLCPTQPSKLHLSSLGVVVALGLSAAGCAGMQGDLAAQGHNKRSSAEQIELVKKWRARELPAQPQRALALLDGLATAEVESLSQPKPSCKKSSSGGSLCSFEVDLGKDADGDDSGIYCTVATDQPVFGVMVKELLAQQRLNEMPTLGTEAVGEGLAVSFVADATRQKDSKTSYGTAKLAAHLAHCYLTLCFDPSAGLRETFTRVTHHFFESLKFKDNPGSPAMFAYGYQERAGERTVGFRFGSLSKRVSPDEGYIESSTHFFLATDEKAWEVRDSAAVVDRDAKGNIEKMIEMAWQDGKGPLSLSARPSEDKRFRLKVEVGNHTSGLESLPKAPLNTELWAAPDLLRVASGAAPSYRYAFIDLLDSDPAFHYITLTRGAPGVLLEAAEPMTGGSKPAAAPTSKDELQLDAHGLVKKEVSTASVFDLIHTWGDLPPILTNKTAKRPGGH